MLNILKIYCFGASSLIDIQIKANDFKMMRNQKSSHAELNGYLGTYKSVFAWFIRIEIKND